MLIVMGAALFPHLTQRKKIGMSVLLFLSLVCLYYTFTRSAWIATIIGLFAVAIMGRRRLMLGLMVGGIMLSLVALPSIAGRFADLGSSTSAAGYSSNSLSWRFSYWGDVLPLASKDPITGIGLNMSSYETSQQKEPHNDFLRAYVETGIIGTLAYLALLVSMVLVARRLAAIHQATSVDVRSIHRGRFRCVRDGLRGHQRRLQRDHRGDRAVVLRRLRCGCVRGHPLP